MKLLVYVVAMVSIVGSGALYWHEPREQTPEIRMPRISLPPGGPGISTPSKPVPAPVPVVENRPNREVVYVLGAEDVIPIINELRIEFEKLPDSPKIETKPMSMDDARRRIESSASFEFALINREQSEGEKHLRATPIAFRSVCLIVNKSNPVASLDEEKIAAIYSGKSVKWTEVGGSDAGISIYQLNSTRNPSKAFYDRLKIDAKTVTNAVAQSEEPQEIVRRVGTDAGAVAFVPYAVVSSPDFRDQNKVKLVAIQGVDPSFASIRDGSYPLAFPVILLTRGEAEAGPARNFLQYITSDAVQDKLRTGLLLPGR